MASTIKVNNIQNQCGANIVNKCSTTITLGASGDNITLACGATQSGFGRTGTVNWDTTAKTANFTAVSGNGYFVNTTSGAITATLPASPSAGDIVSFMDYAATWDSNNLTVGNNSSKIGGLADNVILNTKGQSVTFVYVDATQGWLNTQDSTSNERANPFVAATGGTITTCGDYKIHTFTGPGTFCVSNAGAPSGSNTVDYLVVAGGGGGGGDHGGGGGAGGYRESSGTASGCYTISPLGACVSALPVSIQAYPITVGSGGAGASGGASSPAGFGGNNSVFSTITSAGGGGGGGGCNPFCAVRLAGRDGGSGGGSGIAIPASAPNRGAPGSGNTPPVSPPQGNNGGQGGSDDVNYRAGGGGGGATAVGLSAPAPGPDQPVAGGAGATSSINGTPTARGGGGAGGSSNTPYPGGTGGGGNGGTNPGSGITSGTANTGGGGGGNGQDGAGAAGGSGIVIIRYKYQ